MHLYLIRHGQSFVNLPDWDKTSTEVGLTDLGKQQATAVAAWLPSYLPEFDVMYSSTMKRAKQTSQAIADVYGCQIQFDDRVREIGNNRADHIPWPDEMLPHEYADFWASTRPFTPISGKGDNGESFMHFRARVGHFIEEIAAKHQGKRVVTVCHGGVIESAFHHIYNMGPWVRCEVCTHNTGITHFEYVEHPGREQWRLHFHSRIEHLKDVQAT